MVRALFGSALLLSGLGLAAALVGPTVFGAPGGEPMIVTGEKTDSLHEVRFEPTDCLPTLLLDQVTPATPADTVSGLALTFHKGPDGVTIVASEVATGDPVRDVFVVVLDSFGHVQSVGSAAAFARTRMEPIPAGACLGLDSRRPGLI